MDRFTRAYVECALWSSYDEGCDSNGEMLDANYGPEDILGHLLADIEADCAGFQEKAGDMIAADVEQAGHDFWLTRNGHGAGFWDGDWPEHGDALDKMAKEAGPYSIYVGDDGKLYGLRSE